MGESFRMVMQQPIVFYTNTQSRRPHTCAVDPGVQLLVRSGSVDSCRTRSAAQVAVRAALNGLGILVRGSAVCALF